MTISKPHFPRIRAEASGALYLGFAMLNWMAKDNLIGGIYSRPVAIGNFAHYFILAATLFRLVFAGPLPAILWAVAIVYGIFASWFGWVLFTSPQLRAASRTMRTS